ncbi:hypothetical protein SynMINOS11_01145 [Synechococcus sp. Minos11]|nr:hypothetical protein [Verrucomicrobiota bacterium]QNJ08609.1 hypothetical protein SynMINOS11_01145 [Synechococcus sp. Minos11]
MTSINPKTLDQTKRGGREMNREAVIEFVLEHYKAENHGRVDYDECFGDHLECLSDDSLLACLAWYEGEDWLDQV